MGGKEAVQVVWAGSSPTDTTGGNNASYGRDVWSIVSASRAQDLLVFGGIYRNDEGNCTDALLEECFEI